VLVAENPETIVINLEQEGSYKEGVLIFEGMRKDFI